MSSKYSMRRLRQQRKAEGKCFRCGIELEVGNTKTHCYRCAENISEYMKAKRLKKKKAIRKLKTKVVNKTLYDVMQSKNITVKMVADYVKMSERSVQRWIITKTQPRYYHIRIKINEFLGEEIYSN